ncbi:hypothetical protein GC105_10730 [Alkalibaculum sp. M08DMB]|uniref:Bacteriophage Gp15 protein n=1 Tax=Alkalibaculum sporogenes TaxID=2655001 RepID=A0A6A7KA79_9FIRM|nr:Gp15 family bacteriophage protein [Alkalibaculum sporogenes]MPW26262.1 hypothetical protein [Alkalibaculum sporogenes]
MIAYPTVSGFKAYGKNIKLNLSFDRVLRVFDLLKEDIDEIDKLELSLDILIKNYWNIKSLSYPKKVKIREIIFNEYISPGKKSSSKDEKVLDFKQDASYIYSSFMLDYGIDLTEQQGKLDWRKFIALFQGLSPNTKIVEVIGIRSREIPAPNKHNQKEIEALLKAKAYYALEMTEEEREDQFQRGLDKLVNALEQRAVSQNAKG